MQLTYFAGFVCGYSQTDLSLRYLAALVIIAVVVFLLYKFCIARLKSKLLRIALYVILGILAFLGWHLLYLVFIDGNFFGCPISPLLRI